jgi:beta-glucosidase
MLPHHFRFGVATAAFQVEGAWDADGKGPSNWDALAHGSPGLAGGATGDVACDHYHRLEEDLDLLAELGVDSYRFSVAWSRVQPTGSGAWNPAGVAFYDRLVDGLLSRGVEPVLTVYHWDHPLPLEEAGGWLSRDMVDRFADYAAGLGERFGDRVARWITLNEPLSVTTGTVLGFSRLDGPHRLAGLAAGHHQLLAHGAAVRALRAAGAREVGITINLAGITPADASSAEAALRAEVFEDRFYLDPLLLGTYPVLDGEPVVACSDDDLALIREPIDFLGINWYCPGRVVDASRAPAPTSEPGTLEHLLAAMPSVLGYARVPVPGAPTNLMGWPVVPAAFGDVLRWLRERYPSLPPVHITENGLPFDDRLDEPDLARIAYLSGCLAQVEQAVADGMDIRSYAVWSLLDNLEWGLGYGPRFGLVHVDFETLARTPKQSFHWYRDLVAAHRAERRERAS